MFDEDIAKKIEWVDNMLTKLSAPFTKAQRLVSAPKEALKPAIIDINVIEIVRLFSDARTKVNKENPFVDLTENTRQGIDLIKSWAIQYSAADEKSKEYEYLATGLKELKKLLPAEAANRKPQMPIKLKTLIDLRIGIRLIHTAAQHLKYKDEDEKSVATGFLDFSLPAEGESYNSMSEKLFKTENALADFINKKIMLYDKTKASTLDNQTSAPHKLYTQPEKAMRPRFLGGVHKKP